MQQITITLPDHAIQALKAYCRARAMTPAEIVSSLITKLPVENAMTKPMDIDSILRDTCGAWKMDDSWEGVDSVDYQRKIRAEWDRDFDEGWG